MDYSSTNNLVLKDEILNRRRSSAILIATRPKHRHQTVLSMCVLNERSNSACKTMKRLVKKNGQCNILFENVQSRNWKYLYDYFTTILDLKWRYVIALFSFSHVITWFFFSFIWFLLLIIHGDNDKNDSEKRCFQNIYNYGTSLMYSIETQYTIGYGYRNISCPSPDFIIVLMMQCIVGSLVDCLMAGITFAKMARPKHRAETLMFSTNAVICLRDGSYLLMFRIADIRKESNLNCVTTRAVLIHNYITEEGEFIALHEAPLKIKSDNSFDEYMLLAWPTNLIHVIDESSPLWGVSQENLETEFYEIVVYLEGTVESSGMAIQIRSSYISDEILWGHVLSPIVTYESMNGCYEFESESFHNTRPLTVMPKISAKKYFSNE